MWFPQNITITVQILTIMKKELKISAASNVVAMSGCSKDAQSICGIMYRFG